MGLDSRAVPSKIEAKEAYRRQAKERHPDSRGPAADEASFKKLQEAWRVVEQHSTMMKGGSGHSG